MDPRFAPHGYFSRIIDEMVNAGYSFVAKVRLTSPPLEYHVSAFAEVAETRLFFHGGGSLIVMLEYTEQVGELFGAASQGELKPYNAYWSSEIYYKYDWEKFYRDWYSKQDQTRWWSDDPIPTLEPDFLDRLKELGWRQTGGMADENFVNWDFEWDKRDHSQNRVNPIEVVQGYIHLKAQLKPFMYPSFRSLQVTSFPPHYTFPGPVQEALFWEKFPIHRLRKVVQHMWGSSFGISRRPRR